MQRFERTLETRLGPLRVETGTDLSGQPVVFVTGFDVELCLDPDAVGPLVLSLLAAGNALDDQQQGEHAS